MFTNLFRTIVSITGVKPKIMLLEFHARRSLNFDINKNGLTSEDFYKNFLCSLKILLNLLFLS